MAGGALVCRELVKTFEGTRALDGLDLSVESGTVFGLLGPKAFMIMTVLVPALLGVYMLSAPMLMRSANTELRLAILDTGTDLGRALGDQLREFERPHIVVTETATVQAADPAARERFNAAIRARALDGYVVIERDDSRAARVGYFARETGNVAFIRDLRLAVQSAALGKLLANTDVDSRDVRNAQQLDIDVTTVSDRGERHGGIGAALAFTMALAMLLYLTVLINSWIASKIFRYALLMTGKRPTLPELVRVVKAG